MDQIQHISFLLLEHSHAHSFTYCLRSFHNNWLTWVGARDHIGCRASTDPLQKKFANPWSIRALHSIFTPLPTISWGGVYFPFPLKFGLTLIRLALVSGMWKSISVQVWSEASEFCASSAVKREWGHLLTCRLEGETNDCCHCCACLPVSYLVVSDSLQPHRL